MRESVAASPATNAPAAATTPFPPGRILFAGSPDTVVEQVRAFHALTGVGVLDLLFSSVQLPVADIQRSIELFGREVLPRIRGIGEAATPALSPRALP